MNKKTIVVRSKKPQKSFFQKCISLITRRKTFTFLSIAILLIAIPLTVVQSLHIQDNRQRADSDGLCANACDSKYTSCKTDCDYYLRVNGSSCDRLTGQAQTDCNTRVSAAYTACTQGATGCDTTLKTCQRSCTPPSTTGGGSCYETCIERGGSDTSCESQCSSKTTTPGEKTDTPKTSDPREPSVTTIAAQPNNGCKTIIQTCTDTGCSNRSSCDDDCSYSTWGNRTCTQPTSNTTNTTTTTPDVNKTICESENHGYCDEREGCATEYTASSQYSCSNRGHNFGSCCVKRTSPPVVTPGKKTTVTPAGSGSYPGSTGGKGICLPSGFYSVGGEPCATPTPVKKTGSTTPGASSPNVTSAPTVQTTCANNPIQPPVNKIWKAYCSSSYKCVTNDDCKKVLSSSGGETQCYAFTNGSYCMQLQFDTIAGTCRDNPQAPPGANQVWKADCGGKTCKEHSDCPQNPAYASNPNDKSNWCYGFDDGARCMMLQEKNGNTTASTPTTSSSSATSKSVTSTVIDTIKAPFVTAWDAITGFVTSFFK